MLDASRALLLGTIGSRRGPAVEARVDPNRWSVAEIAEHLAKTETGITGGLAQKLGARSDLGAEPDSSSILDSFDPARATNREERWEAPEFLIPTPGVSLPAAIAALESSRAKLLELLERADGHAVGEVGFKHPFLGPLNFYQWVLFIAYHERRHTLQIEEMLR